MTHDAREAPGLPQHEWRVPRFLWVNAFRFEGPSPDDPIDPHQPVGYHGIWLQPDWDGDYFGAGILEDRRRGRTCPIHIEVHVSDHLDRTTAVRLLRKLADHLEREAVWSLLAQARGREPLTLDLNTMEDLLHGEDEAERS